MSNPEKFAINSYGRFVSGDLLEKKTTDHLGKPELNPEKHKFNFGIAFRKDDPALAAFFTQVFGYLSATWATDAVKLQALQTYFTPNPQTGTYGMQGLSMKISDGDAPTGQDQTVNSNTVGHYILWCATKYAPKVTDSAYQEIPLESMKRGYYCAILGTFADNGLAYSADGKGAGIYLNIQALVLLAEGDVIAGGSIDVASAMAGKTIQGAMPSGARALGSSAGMMPGVGMTTGGPTMPGMGNVQQQVPQSVNVGMGMPQNGMVNVPLVAGGTTSPNVPGVQGQPQTGHVATQTMPGMVGQQPALQQTASPSNVMPQPHTGILQPGQQQQVQMPGMGQAANVIMPGMGQ